MIDYRGLTLLCLVASPPSCGTKTPSKSPPKSKPAVEADLKPTALPVVADDVWVPKPRLSLGDLKKGLCLASPLCDSEALPVRRLI